MKVLMGIIIVIVIFILVIMKEVVLDVPNRSVVKFLHRSISVISGQIMDSNKLFLCHGVEVKHAVSQQRDCELE